MPVLKNQRHERFAQELAKGNSATDAYIAAGYAVTSDKSAGEAGSRLSKNVKVRERVVELQSRGAARAEVTVESLIAEAEEARRLAMSQGQPSAAVAAIREKGVLSGKRIERSEHGGAGEFADIENMTADELRAYIASGFEADGVCEEDFAEGSGARAPRRELN